MRREVIVEAPNEEKAIELAAQLLGVSLQEAKARIEILRPAGRGFLGLVQRPLRARVTFDLPEVDSASTVPGQTLAEVTGGRLVIHPGDPDKPVTVKAGEGVVLLVDGVPHTGPVTLTGDEEVTAYPIGEDALPEPGFQIVLSGDKLSADLILTPAYEYHLQDVPPGKSITLRARRKAVLPEGVTKAAIMEHLAEMGIVFGIDDEAIDKILQQPEDGRFRIARGQAPQPGRDGYADILVNIEDPTAALGMEPGADENIDFRYRPEIVFVEEGSAIAQVHPPTAGLPGCNVLGEEIPATPGKPLVVVTGKGVRPEQLPDGIVKYTAVRSGRPVVRKENERRCYLDVVECYIHTGDVNMASGNVQFRGDVLIRGEVDEGMTVSGGRVVEIAGNVSGGIVIAGDGIRIRGGVLQGQVSAGAYGLLHVFRQHDLDQILKELKMLQQMVAQALSAASQRGESSAVGPGRIARILLNSKLKGLPGRVAALVDGASSYGPPFAMYPELDEVFAALGDLAKLSIRDDFDLKPVIAGLESIRQELELSAAAGDVEVGFVHAGKVSATGNITVGRRGTYFSELFAGSDVIVNGPVIGGVVKAGQRIKVAEAGSVALPLTVLSVAEKGVISIGVAHPNTRLEIGGMVHRVEKESYKIRVRVVDGRIEVGVDS